MINGVWADEAHRLRPDVWVNIWEVDDMGQTTFYGDCRVSEFEIPDEGLDYGLEPIDENGNAIALEDALR